MGSRSLLFLFLISVLEIGSANISTEKKQTHLWAPYMRYQTVPVMLPEESSHVPQLYGSSTKVLRKLNPTTDRRYRTKKIHRWLDPIGYKKSRSPKTFTRPRKPKKNYPSEDWNYRVEGTNISDNSDSPSVYLEPPKTTNNNYHYSEKSRKTLDNRWKKPIRNQTTGYPKNHRLPDESDDENRLIYTRDHAPEQQVEATDDKETNDGDEKNEKLRDTPGESRDRIEFHIQGHEGPESYIFGFDTGDGENRQYRMEERHEDGTVTGHYGYVDARGKLRKVQYKASPTHGYEEKHHDTNEQEV